MTLFLHENFLKKETWFTQVHTATTSHVSFNPHHPSFTLPFLSPSPQAVAAVLNNPNEPVSDLSYFDCLDLVINKSKVLGEAGAHITTHAALGSS